MRALKEVYSFMFPEVRKVYLDTMSREDFLLQLLRPPKEMDVMHEPVLKKYVEKHPNLQGLAEFPFRYPTAGSEEGIREFLTFLAVQNVDAIYVLKGEYEGYRFTGESRGIKTIEIPEETKPSELKPGWFFISNPSARDGNIIPNEFIRNVCEAGHNVFYDLAYADSTRPHEFDLTHENIKAAVISFSKPYGLFYVRIGAAFSREAIPSLYANKWFKVVPSLLVADKVMDEINPEELYSKYRPVQEEIVMAINEEDGLGLRISDALLLAHLKKGDAEKLTKAQLEMIELYKRGDGYRFCLKPYYEEKVK